MEEQYNEEQEQPQVQASPYYQPTIMPSDKADLYDKIRPDEAVTTIKYLLMGYYWNSQESKWVINKGLTESSLTEAGATKISTLMYAVSNQNVSISKINDTEIRNRTKSLVRSAMIICMRNWREYGIIGKDQIYLIKELVLSNSFITLKQPENGGIRQLLMGTTQESKSIVENHQNKGGIGSLFRR